MKTTKAQRDDERSLANPVVVAIIDDLDEALALLRDADKALADLHYELVLKVRKRANGKEGT